MLTLRTASGSVRALDLQRAASISAGGALACVCAAPPHCVFLGARTSESLLVEMRTHAQADEYRRTHGGREWGAPRVRCVCLVNKRE